MPLTIGTTLGSYRVLGPLGAGGMGEVYRALDTQLDREVAVKVLPHSMANDPERLARFDREAKILAALNHPNIAVIYSLEKFEGGRALVMELVPGDTLGARIKKGPMPLDEALPVAKQIAEALEAAHEKGVIHRDLKPGNVMITPTGLVKVLDFGLAAMATPAAHTGDPENSPTLTMGMTAAGTIMGTAAYMAPEQAAGLQVDRRADVWSFGAVLWEMLTGKRLFTGGESISHTLADVLRAPINFDQVPAGPVRKLLKRCLERNLRSRLQAIAEARIAIEEIAAAGEGGAEAPQRASSPPSMLPWAVTGVATLALVVTAFTLWPKAPELKPLVRLDLELNPPPGSNMNNGPTVVLSPDGSRLVWVAEGKLFTRRLDEAESHEIAGTQAGAGPFFSPDGQWIGFMASSLLKKVSVEGGSVVTISQSSLNQAGASWGDDGNIVFAPTGLGNLSTVNNAGGKAAPAFAEAMNTDAAYQMWPHLLPGSRSVLLSAGNGAVGVLGIRAVDLNTGTSSTLIPPQAIGPRYVATPDGDGYLLYVNGTSLNAVRFDPDRLRAEGAPIPVLDQVLDVGASRRGVQFDVSRNGTFVFRRGVNGGGSERLSWVDSSGKKTPLLAKSVSRPKFSPEGNRVAFEDNGDVWVYEWQRDTSIRLTSNGFGQGPIWTPDGRFVLYNGLSGIYWTRSDGASQPQLFLPTKTSIFPWSISPDGKRLAYLETGDNGWDISTVPMENDGTSLKAGKPEPFLKTAVDERYPSFSPDGRWLAYSSSQSGIHQTYVRSFPDKGGQWQVSNNGGTYPEWGRDGKTLFFRSLENKIQAVTYTVKGDAFSPERPREWSGAQLADVGMNRSYDMHPDGKRMAALLPAELTDGAKPDTHVTILFNFLDELKRKVK